MITRHPYRAVAVVVAVMVVAGFVSGMIGQFNDGPWGGLPAWLGATTWFTFLATVPLLAALLLYLAVAALLRRRRVAPR